MGRRIVREDEVDTTAEIAQVFQQVIDNQYILEGKIEQLESKVDAAVKDKKKSKKKTAKEKVAEKGGKDV